MTLSRKDRLRRLADRADAADRAIFARNAEIIEAREAGLSLREIAEAVRVSHGTVDSISRRAS